eukprot:8539136-Alexandrium_andersonii.AAC.1
MGMPHAPPQVGSQHGCPSTARSGRRARHVWMEASMEAFGSRVLAPRAQPRCYAPGPTASRVGTA